MEEYELEQQIKNISEEEKQNELFKSVIKQNEQISEREFMRKKQQYKKSIIFLIVLILVILMMYVSIEFDLKEEYINYGIFGVVATIFFCYAIFYGIKIKKQEKSYKKISKKEIPQLQQMYNSLINNFSIESTQKDYKELFKKEVVKKYIESIEDNLQYSEKIPQEKIKEEYYNAGFDIENDWAWQLNIEDYICGEIPKNTFFEMTDVLSYTEKSYRARKGYQELFYGNFIILDVNTCFEKASIRLRKVNYYDKNQLLTTNNLKFDKYFKIYTQNKESVQTYLTPSLIQFIADFREKYQIDFEIIFKDKIYIRFFTGDMFEPKMFGKIVDEYSVYKFYVITKFAKELVEKLGIDN